MTHRGPFQPLLFCDSVILCLQCSRGAVQGVQHSERARSPKHGPGILPLLPPRTATARDAAQEDTAIPAYGNSPLATAGRDTGSQYWTHLHSYALLIFHIYT